MNKVHKVLERQLKRFIDEGGAVPASMEKFLRTVSDFYTHADEDRLLLERSLELSSAELTSINEQQEKQNEELILSKNKLEKAKAQAEALLFNMGEAVVATDNLGQVFMMNREAERLLGWHLKEVKGKMWTDVLRLVDEQGRMPPSEPNLFCAVLSSGKKSEAKIGNYIYYEGKGGTRFPVSGSISPIVVGKKLIGAINVFRDATVEHEIDKAKTEFVSLASHQLRTPLSAINWYAEMLLAEDVGKLQKQQKRYFNKIYLSSLRMVTLVDALLNVSRFELGTFLFEPVPTKILPLAQSSIDEQKPAIKEKKLRLKSKLDAHLPVIQADPKLLRLVFQNLISNAVKYTPEGGSINLSLKLVKKGKPIDGTKAQKDCIVIVVSDTGYGIPKSQQDKIFTKLFRADNVKETDTEGTGLGLYLVKSILDHSGGKIWFHSEKEKGATFYVSIPLVLP